MSCGKILRALRHGPATNAELQELVCDHSAGISRDCSRLIQRGQVRRIDGGTGRGSIARYALVEKP